MTELSSPEPLNCRIEGGTGRAEFDCEELREFVQSTKASSFLVRDKAGNVASIQVEPIRKFLGRIVAN